MRICIDLTSLADNFSGIERYALSISKELIMNEKHHWILLFKNQVHEAFLDSKSNVEKVVIKGKNKLFFNQFILPAKMYTIKADKYLFIGFPAPFFFFSKKTINTIFDMGCWDCPRTNKLHMVLYFRLLYWKAAFNNKKIITISDFSKKRIQKILRVKEENICIIYCGIDNKFFFYEKNNVVNEKYSIPSMYFLCLSTIEPRKNIQLLIKAYSRICESIDYDLVLVGRKGWLMDNLFSNLSEKVKEKIVFTGFVDDEDLPSIYGNASWFVFPSLYEGFGIPPLEAMATGTPVLSSNSTAMPEILGDVAFYFENNDVESLIEKLQMISNINLDNNLKVKCINQAKKYSWKESADRLLNFLESI